MKENHHNPSSMPATTADLSALKGEPVPFLHPSTLTKWRQRLGAEGTHALEQVAPQQLAREHVIKGRSLVTDMTAQEKHLAYPTDTVLLDQGRRKLRKLIDQAQAGGVVVAQGLRSCTRAVKRVVLAAMKLGKDRLARRQAANRQLSAMAQPVRRRMPRVLAQIHGKLGAMRRAAPASSTPAHRGAGWASHPAAC